MQKCNLGKGRPLLRTDRTSKISLIAVAACIASGLAVNNARADLVEHCQSSASEEVIPSATVKVVSLRKSGMEERCKW